ncbi:hypothetical protein L914_20138 [Phytophthora nicotianae]|uniref:Integrase zinc-binding domain-containing protein n=1 Tax=Phytophthora nicotianae TaxID=4792 RepID=W2M7U4_PHYNI|nr:hypothetical protein L914_20138 [Phytophthora nicotianae]
MQQESRPVKGRRGAHPDHAQKRAQPIDPDCDPDARSAYGEGFTVNEAEYHGLLLGLGQLSEADQKQLVICGDSNLMARQWIGDDLVHVKRDWNASADSLASSALQKQCKIEVEVEFDYQDTITVNRLEEGFVARSEVQASQISAAQGEEAWISSLKKYLIGDVSDLSREVAKSFSPVTTYYKVDLNDLLFYYPPTKRSDEDRDGLMRLRMPEALHQDILHHYHLSLEGGHQCIGRTYQRIRDRFHWRGLHKSVQRYLGECVDCETGKGPGL